VRGGNVTKVEARSSDVQELKVEGIRKSFDHHVVLGDLSVSFSAGESVVLLGANGSGKSTLLRILAGLSIPDRGTVTCTIGGSRGLVAHHHFLYGALTVVENLELYAHLAGVADIERVLKRWGLEAVRNRAVNLLSKGTQVKVSLARLFLAHPSVLLLDEPTSFLDEQGTATLRDALSEYNGSQQPSLTIIATHDLGRLRSLARRVVVLGGGAIVKDSLSLEKALEDRIEEAIAYYRNLNR